MSEIGTQLVENERKRKEVMHRVRNVKLQLVSALGFDNEDGLAELDIDKLRQNIDVLAGQRQIMRNLQKERRALGAASAAAAASGE